LRRYHRFREWKGNIEWPFQHPGVAQKILRPGRQECSADARSHSGKNRLDTIGLLNCPRHETVLTAPLIDLRC
jgi:hypothetical protein